MLAFSPLPSEEGTFEKMFRTLACEPRPESGLDWLMCATMVTSSVRRRFFFFLYYSHAYS